MSGIEGQLAQANQRIEELEEAVRAAQDELQFFVYAASHDLQQPLRAIGTHAQLLQREFLDNERASEFTNVIVEGVAQINTLITDLLTYSRAGNACHPVMLDLNAPLQWALLNLAKAIQQSGAQVVAGQLPEAYADEQQMVTIFENLIGNALKFHGSEAPRVEIMGQTGEEFHTISVLDNGCGIGSEYHQKVFEPFKRLHGRDVPGSGLGLPTCRKIVRAHGSKIWVESDGSSGTAVRFTVPV